MIVCHALYIALAHQVVAATQSRALVRRQHTDVVVLFFEMQFVVDSLVLFKVFLLRRRQRCSPKGDPTHLVGLDKVRDILFNVIHLIRRHAPIIKRTHTGLEIPHMPSPALV